MTGDGGAETIRREPRTDPIDVVVARPG